MLETIVPNLIKFTDKLLQAVLGTVTVVLVTVTSFTGKYVPATKQTLNFDQKNIKNLKILAETNSNLSGNININLPVTLNETVLAKKDVTVDATLVADKIGVNTIPTYAIDINGDLKVSSRVLLGTLTTDPTGINGAIYYNSTSNKFPALPVTPSAQG